MNKHKLRVLTRNPKPEESELRLDLHASGSLSVPGSILRWTIAIATCTLLSVAAVKTFTHINLGVLLKLDASTQVEP